MACRNSSVVKIGTSILNSDLSCLFEECKRFSDSDYLHLDVMDGHFVPNLTFGHPVVSCLKPKLPNVFFDMHMMVSHPHNWVEPMANANADQFVFHFEAVDNSEEKALELIRAIKESGMKAGVAVKPGTSIDLVSECLVSELDTILIMTVEPGFGGQKLQHEQLSKVSILRKRRPDLAIGVDGGVNLDNISAVTGHGTNYVVSGTAITKSVDPSSAIAQMRTLGVQNFSKLL